MFNLTASFRPTGDQPQAIAKLTKGARAGQKNQVLLGVTGSGKTFTMANVIKELQMPALIISHNKTLAGQLYQEFRDFFPDSAVSYFVSYYDYYQPEAYLPATDVYIEKEAQINELIDKLRLKSTTNILTGKDVIVVASVSCIYNIGSPREYGNFILEINIGQEADFNNIFHRLAQLQYERNEFDFRRGSFRVRGDRIDIYPAYEDCGYRLIINDRQQISEIKQFEPISGKILAYNLKHLIIYPAKHYMTDPNIFASVEKQIRSDLKIEYEELKSERKFNEAERLLRRVNYDLEMIKEVGYVNGIENYSRYFDGRRIGEAPYSLIDYFKETYGDEFLVFIDESHMTVPQIRGMYNGDLARKKTLVDFGFRLRAAFDNRPLKFDEFYKKLSHIIYVSATPDDWEISMSKVVEQLIRPTGIVDPKITIRKAQSEVQDLIGEIEKRAAKKERVLATTLTKKMAEDLTAHLKDKNIKAAYLHSDIKTLERSDVLDNLRKNEFDVLIGVNLLREGLDLPEVTLVAILDADKEGFLRSRTSLIQTMGRAARNISGEVILYADTITDSMKRAINEINRRRRHQSEYNSKHHISPKTVVKPVRERIVKKDEADKLIGEKLYGREIEGQIDQIKVEALTPFDRNKFIKKLEREMKKQAQDLNFELAIKIRDKVKELKHI